MTIKELKEAIENLPDEMEVILQKDSEGNGYSPLDGVDYNCVYVPDNTWSGYVYSIGWNANDACMPEDEWQEIKSRARALVLLPIN